MKKLLYLLGLAALIAGCAHDPQAAGGSTDTSLSGTHRGVSSVPDGTDTKPGGAR